MVGFAQANTTSPAIRAYRNPLGLDVRFIQSMDGWLCARLALPERLRGHAGIVHGGVLSTLLDEAMSVCLFRREIFALTAEFTLRYKLPVPVGEEIELAARVERERPPLYELSGRVVLGDRPAVLATARFMEPTGKGGAGHG